MVFRSMINRSIIKSQGIGIINNISTTFFQKVLKLYQEKGTGKCAKLNIIKNSEVPLQKLFEIYILKASKFLVINFLFKFVIVYRENSEAVSQSCSIKKGVFPNFAKLTGKHLCQSFFF